MKLQCTICTELYERCSEISALSCGHLFHNYCIHKWLESSSSCPQCRKKLGRKDIIQKLYLDHVDETDATQQSGNSERAENELSSIRVKLTVREQEKRTLEVKLGRLEDAMKLEESKFTRMQTLYQEEQITSKSLKKQVDGLKGQQEQVKQAKLEVDTMRQYLTDLKNVETVVKGAETDVTAMMSEYGDGNGSVKHLATCCVMLKRELEILKQTKKRMKEESEKNRRAACNQQRELSFKNEQIKRLEKDLKKMSTCSSPTTPQLISRVRVGDVAITSPNLTPQPVHTCQTTNVFDRSDDPVVATLNFNKRKHSDNGKTDGKLRIAGQENIKKHKSDSVDIAPMMRSYAIMQKKMSSNTIDKFSLRVGYDGLGSHGKFIPTNAQQKPKQSKMSHFYNR